MSFTAAQCRAARALIGWSQDQLAEASKVAKATIANFELGKRDPYLRTLDDLREALEAAGVEFTNGGQPGVRLKGNPTMIARPKITSSSMLSVRLSSRSESDQIVIAVERAAIDDYFGLRNSTPEERRRIVAKNLDAITRIANDRYVRRNFSIVQIANARHAQIVLRLEDLRKETLVPPISNESSSVVQLLDDE